MCIFSLVLIANTLIFSRRIAFGMRITVDAFVIPFLAYFLARRLVKNEMHLNKIIQTISYLGVYIIIIGLIERLSHSQLLYRLQGPFGSSNSLYVAMATVFFLTLLDTIRNRNMPGQGAIPRGVRYFVLGLAPLIIFFNFTRGDWLGFLLGIWVLFFLGRKLIDLPRKVGIIGAILVLLPAIGLAVVELVPSQIAEQRVGRTGTIYGRLGAWQLLIQESIQQPILGHGLNTTRDFLHVTRINYQGVKSEDHAHNSYLAFLFETGIVGLVIYLAIVFSIIRIGLNLYRNEDNLRYRWLGVFVGVIMVSYLVPACFGNTLYLTNISPIYIYTYVGAVASLHTKRRESFNRDTRLLLKNEYRHRTLQRLL